MQRSGSARLSVPSIDTLAPVSEGKEKHTPGSWKSDLQGKACTPRAEMTERMEALIYNKVVPTSIQGRSALVEDLAIHGEREVLHDLLEKGGISTLILTRPLGQKGCVTWKEATCDGCPAIKRLGMQGIKLDEVDSRHLLWGVSNLRGLTNWRIADCVIKPAHDESSFLANLKSLDIVCDSETLPLLNWILRSSVHIDLTMDTERLDQKGHEDLALLLARLGAPKMLTIDAHMFKWGQHSVAFRFYKQFLTHPNLSCLTMEGPCNENRAFSLLSALEKNKGIAKLVLRNCDLQFDVAVASALGRLVGRGRLLELDLSGNEHINECLPYMFSMFGSGASIRRINLQKTGAGKQTIVALAKWLKKNETLTHLCLPNPQKTAYLQPLVDVLSKHTQLLRIRCGRLDQDDDLVQELGELIRRNRFNFMQSGVRVVMNHLQSRRGDHLYELMPREISNEVASILSEEQDDSVLNVALVNHQALEGFEKQQSSEEPELDKLPEEERRETRFRSSADNR